MTETERARRLVIAYAILLHALERSYPELKPEYSFVRSHLGCKEASPGTHR
jgi:hypothetical protein